jgi:hypothetical protein
MNEKEVDLALLGPLMLEVVEPVVDEILVRQARAERVVEDALGVTTRTGCRR